MTLEESTQRLKDAVDAEDFALIAQLLALRSAAIKEFRHTRPSAAAFAVATNALKAGEEARTKLQTFQRRALADTRRLSQIQQVLSGNAARPRRPRIDCRG